MMSASVVLSRYYRRLLLMAGALLLAGCVSVPDAIKGTTDTPQQSLLAVQAAPEIYVGQEARFGGTVVDVKNSEHQTRLEIASVPLDGVGRPLLGTASQGRLFADVAGFLEPSDFRGRLVTVVGSITGSEAGKIGETPYKFVVIKVTGYKRWTLRQEVVMPPAPMPVWGPDGPRHHYGYPYTYPWGWYDRGPGYIETVIE